VWFMDEREAPNSGRPPDNSAADRAALDDRMVLNIAAPTAAALLTAVCRWLVKAEAEPQRPGSATIQERRIQTCCKRCGFDALTPQQTLDGVAMLRTDLTRLKGCAAIRARKRISTTST
jgi:hypothetical protein